MDYLPENDEHSVLDQFGQALAETRKDAIQARQSSGIEDIWREDEEFYEGIDDANRHEHRQMYHQKPWGRASIKAPGPQNTRSTVFPNITRPYCDMAAARISDMLMPTDDRAFAIKATPIPDLISLSKGKASPQLSEEANMMPDPTAYIQQAQAQADQMIAEADEKAEKAQERIDDWLTECRFQSENRRVIEDASRIGVGVLKGPIPEVKSVKMYSNGGLVIREEVKPVSKRIDPWNFFPDGACGENIHNGSYTWERDYLTKKQLRDLKKQEGYIVKQIDLCLKEGPQEATADHNKKNEDKASQRFEVWYYYGTAEREHLEAAGMEFEEDEGDHHLNVMVVMVNHRVIKAVRSHLDSGEFPYDVMIWQRRSSSWAGIGVARQIRTPQRITTGATRNLMDNAGLAAGPMMVFLQGVLSPTDGVLGAGPRKTFFVADDSAIIDARKAIASIKVDMLVNEMMEIINLGMRLAEDVTGMPMLLQGQLGKAPDTVGGMEMLFNSASSVLRRLARLYDDLITEPHVGRYYTWLLQYGDDNEKGDFNIQARGSSALVERSIQSQELAQILQFSQVPTYGIDPKKAVGEYLKSRHFDPANFEYDDEEWKQIVEQLAQPQQSDPREAIAQMRMEVDQLRIQSNEGIAQAKLAAEKENKAADRDLEAHLAEKSDQLTLALTDYEAELTKELEAIKADGSKSISFDRSRDMLEKIKADIGRDVMKLKVQKELSGTQAITPAVEPKGRAPEGQAFQK